MDVNSSATELSRTTAISDKVSIVKLCVPLNHFVTSDGFISIFSANSLLLHPFAVSRSSNLAAKVIFVFTCILCTGVISFSNSETTRLLTRFLKVKMERGEAKKKAMELIEVMKRNQ